MQWLHHLKTLFYPDNCPVCNNLLRQGEENICLPCESELPKLPHRFFDGNPIESSFYNNTKVNGANAFLSFIENGKAQKIIHQIKYKNNTNLGKKMGELAAYHSLEKNPQYKPEVILPVPLHFSKQKKRGYNQCDQIANGLSSVFQVPANLKAVKRKVATASQTNIARFERFENMKNIFEVIDSSAITNKEIMIVDDVVTTGATLTSLCNEVLKFKPKSIVLYAIAFKV